MERDDPVGDATACAADVEESMDDLYEDAPCGYFSTRDDGTIVRVNRTFLGWTGYARDELVESRRVQDLLAPGARIYYETHYAPLLRMQGEVREIAVEIVRADGSRLPVLLNSVLVRGSGAERALVRTTVFDARERRRYERELLAARRDAEERARAALALAHVSDGVLLVDPDGRVQVVNEAAAALLGVAADAAIGRPAGEAIRGWSTLAARAPVGSPQRWPDAAMLPLARSDGESWIAVAGVDSGEGIVYTLRDVTAERRLEELRSDVIAVVSHELRTPLAAMYGAAQTLLHQEALAPALRAELLAVIVEQGEAQKRVLDQVTLSSGLDSGAVEVADDVLAAEEVVASVARAFDTSAASARIYVEAGDEAVRIRGDRPGLEQVLRNLVANALAYTPPDSPVRLRIERQGRRGRFLVCDDGPGIPHAARERIFERFYRLDPQQRSGVTGVGLGLYVARELVERMHGRIGVLPTERGATFFVDLPLAT